MWAPFWFAPGHVIFLRDVSITVIRHNLNSLNRLFNSSVTVNNVNGLRMLLFLSLFMFTVC